MEKHRFGFCPKGENAMNWPGESVLRKKVVFQNIPKGTAFMIFGEVYIKTITDEKMHAGISAKSGNWYIPSESDLIIPVNIEITVYPYDNEVGRDSG